MKIWFSKRDLIKNDHASSLIISIFAPFYHPFCCYFVNHFTLFCLGINRIELKRVLLQYIITLLQVGAQRYLSSTFGAPEVQLVRWHKKLKGPMAKRPATLAHGV